MPYRPTRPTAATGPRGQSLAEFALVFPILMLILGAIIQFGVIFWGQNTLTQIARDTGRWASTQNECDTTAARNAILTTAQAIADASSLVGPSSGWAVGTNVVVTWRTTDTPTPPCPPVNNGQVWFVNITIHHRVPVFFPWIPGDGNLTTQAEFRMEPHP